jgi:hypothetical protein
MRSLRTLLAVTLLATGAIAVAGAAPASAVTVNCGLKRMSIVFWPKGNKANSLAHMDFYPLTRSFRSSALLGSIDREGGGTFVPRCKHRRQPTLHSVTRAARTTRATALRCGFPRSATIAVHPISSEDEELGIHVVVGRRTVLFAQLFSDHAPRLTYNKVYCHRARLPG